MEEEQKGVEKVEGKNSKKKVLIFAIVIGIIVILLAIFSVIFSLLNMGNEKIITGIYIENINVSDMKKEEAKKLMEDVITEKLKSEIKLVNGEYSASMTLEQIDVTYDIDKAIQDAYEMGRNGNIVTNNYTILTRKIKKLSIDIPMSYSEEELNKQLEGMNANIPGAVTESDYYIEEKENTLIITKGKEGLKIKQDELKQNIIKSLNDFTKSNEAIQIPVETVKPTPIDLEKIHSEVYKEPQDARIEKEPFKLYPHVDGVDFAISIEEAKKLLEEDKEEYTIPLKITKPEITTNKLGEEAFPELISTFKTNYDAGNKARSTNLALAAGKINGTVVNPGETFSYNKVVGERTIAAGYKEAKIYENGKVVDGLGGGICQISSTLYNTVLFANLEIVSRRNHQFLTSYVGAGRDATVVYGSTDFKFKNTRSYPIKLKCSVSNGVAKISIYGIKEETEYKVDIKTTTTETIPFTTSYIEDATMEAGKEVVKQKGANGCRSETYKVVSLNGKVISRTLLSKDTYNPMQKIIAKGTKNVQNANSEQQVETKEDTPTEELPVNNEIPVEPNQEEPSQDTQPNVE